jgi:hypothetical protein
MRNSAQFVFQKTGDDSGHQSDFAPLAQRRIPENAQNFSVA